MRRIRIRSYLGCDADDVGLREKGKNGIITNLLLYRKKCAILSNRVCIIAQIYNISAERSFHYYEACKDIKYKETAEYG